MANEEVIWYSSPKHTITQSMSVIFSLAPVSIYGGISRLMRLTVPHPAVAFHDHMAVYIFFM
jgi:hypothetical protein